MVDLDTDVLHAVTPALLRAWLKVAPRLDAVRMKQLLTAAMQAADDIECSDRPGFSTRVTDHTWLATLVAITGNAIFNEVDRLHNLEVGYTTELIEKLDAEREVKAEAMRQAGATEVVHAELAEAVSAMAEENGEPVAAKAPAATRDPVRAAEFPLEYMPPDNDLLEGDESLATHDAEAELYLPAARTTQLTLPHIVMRSPIIAMKPRNAVRPMFTDAEPLRIARISGMRQGTVDMSYVGEELRSGDWETFAYILRFAATVPLGARTPSIRVVDMLKAMGRDPGSNNRKELAKQLQRLRNAELRVWTNDVAVVESWQALFLQEPLFKRGDISGVRTSFKLLGDIVEAKSEKGNTLKFTTELSRYVRAFFGQKLSSWYSESMYQQLTGDLAKRLFLFYQSHDGRFDFTFDELVEFLGASTDREQFGRSLKAAHDELTAACFIKGWSLKASSRRNGQRAYVLHGLTVEKKTKVDKEYDLN
ncbi:hypothetical protein [Paraburkholderia sp. UCT70]|uniref:hypothetical protein n=1 Tax=Paraburkholderia sp. UCT70 TaxID=2991068 RepID=UPI003D19645A